jgi:hypothetical protein
MLVSLELITNRISFGTHVVTVRDYLNWYRMTNNDKERQNGSTIFAEYLVSACWRKMERRIGHWASVGLMTQLYDNTLALSLSLPINDQVFRDTQSDFKLSAYLRALEKTDNLKKILKFRPTHSDVSTIDSNETKIEQGLPCLLLRCRDNPHNLYIPETVVEFHHLLVACLLYYAKSIRELRIFHKVDMNIRRLIQSIKKKQAKEYTMEESEERTPKEGNVETKDLEFSAQLKLFIDGEVDRMPSLQVDEVDDREAKEKSHLKKIAKLKFYLDGKSNKMQLFLDNVTPEAAEEAKQGERMEKNLELLTKLKSYFDMKLSKTPSSLSAINSNDKFGAVFFSSRILNAVLVSGAFRRHIEILVTRGLLNLPSDTLQNIYRKFAEDHRIPWRQSRDGVPQTVGKIGNADLDLEDGDAESEKDQEPLLSHRGDLALAIQGCVKLFVQHHHAKTILESFFRHEGREFPIEIKVYGLSSPENLLPLPTWEALKTAMRSSLQDKTAEDQDKIINVFESHFKTSDDTNDDSKSKADNNYLSPRKNAIYNMIGNIITQKATTTKFYNIHCEVALAGLVAASKFPSDVARFVDKDFLDELNVGIPSILQLRQLTHIMMYLQKLIPKEVAVSKLCCPACWEYFDILSKKHTLPGEAEMYKIRGRHSTLFPVQLPIWTPTDVVKELNIRFKRYLRNELDTMWSDHLEQIPRSGHRNTPSFQSVSSATTDASKNSAESNLDTLNVSLPVPGDSAEY